MKKIIEYGINAREKMLSGIEKLFRAVAPTFGGEGKNTVFGKQFGVPESTRDGVTVAKNFDLEDETEKLASDLMKIAALKTNDDVGDGTTTAIILAYWIIKNGFEEIKAQNSPIKINKGLLAATQDIVKQSKEQAEKITTKEQMAQIGNIAARDKEIGELIADVVYSAGENRVIDVQDSKNTETTKEVVKGLKIEKGYISQYFITNPEKMTAEYEDVDILITDQKISNITDILPLIEKLEKQGLMIIADDIDGDALTGLVVNKLNGKFKSLAIKAPGFGDNKKDILKDMAVITGGTLITEEKGMKLIEVEPGMLGKAERVVASKSETIIVGGGGNKKEIDNRIKQLKSECDLVEGKYDKENIQKRIAGLTGGIAVIKVGASSEIEQKEKKYRVEDAVAAVSAAVEEGVICGGGIPLLEIAEKLDDKTPSNRILKKALQEPFKKNLENAWVDEKKIIDRIRKEGFKVGYDVVKGDFGTMFEIGIIDPVKVTRTALENAISVASSILITETTIAIKQEETPVVGPPQQPMM